MINFGMLCLGILFFTSSIITFSQPQFEDPHSLYYRKRYKVKAEEDATENQHTALQVERDQVYAITHNDLKQIFRTPDNYCDGEDCTNPYATFCRRLVNLIVLNSNLRGDGQVFFGKLDLHIAESELELLKGFGNGAKLSIAEIDEILQKVILPADTSIYDTAFYWMDSSFIFVYRHRIIFVSMLLLGLILLLAFKVRWTFIRIVLLLFYLGFIVTYFMTWWELIQKAEAEQLANQKVYSDIPAECRQKEMSFSESIIFFFGVGKGACYKYMEAQLAQPELKITPLHVFIHVCSKSVLQPLTLLGKEVSKFASEITGHLPVPLNYITEAVLIMVLPILCSLIYFVWIGGGIGFSFGLFSFFLKKMDQTTPCVNCDGKTNGRQAVEIIKQEYKIIQPTKKDTQESIKRIDGKVDVGLDPIEDNSGCDDFVDLIDTCEDSELTEELKKLFADNSGRRSTDNLNNALIRRKNN